MTTDEAVAYIIDVEFVWGYQATVAGLTKSPPPYTYPPPTTLLGALAEAVARSEGLGEDSLPTIMNVLTKNLIAIALKSLNCVPLKYQDINRVIAVRESSGVKYPSPERIQKSFDAPARGKTLLTSLDGDSPKIEWVLIWSSRPNINRGGACLEARHFWRIHRIGSKESLASVINVAEKPAKMLVSDTSRFTSYSFPLKAVSEYKPRTGTWIVETYADPFKPYDKKESPALRYLRGDVAYFASPVLESTLDEPLAWVKPSSKGVLFEVPEISGVIVGVRE